MSIQKRLSPQIDLTKEEEYNLIERAKKGCKEAMELLYRAQVSQVVFFAKNFAKRHEHYWEDLLNEGFMGVSEAVKRFDFTQGGRLSTYSQFWVRKYMQNFIRRMAHPVKKTRNVTEKRVLHEVNNDQMSQEEIMILYQMSDQELQDIIDRGNWTFDSMFTPCDSDIATKDSYDMEEDYLSKEIMHRCSEIAIKFYKSGNLTPSEKKIWVRRTVAIRPVGLETLGVSLGFTKEWVRQLETRLKKKFEEFCIVNVVNPFSTE